jgi:hypothetical protein
VEDKPLSAQRTPLSPLICFIFLERGGHLRGFLAQRLARLAAQKQPRRVHHTRDSTSHTRRLQTAQRVSTDLHTCLRRRQGEKRSRLGAAPDAMPLPTQPVGTLERVYTPLFLLGACARGARLCSLAT